LATVKPVDSPATAGDTATPATPPAAPATVPATPATVAPATVAPATPATAGDASEPAIDVLARYNRAEVRKRQYVDTGERAPIEVPELSSDDDRSRAFVHLGERARDNLPVFYVQDGNSQPYCMPISAVAAIIAGDLVSVPELRAMFARAGRVNALDLPAA
jgi:hypothetical protein